MLQHSCGNAGIMPVVLWPWPRGQFLGPEGGAAPLASTNWGYWAVCWTGRMNSWRVGGQWGPAGATEVRAIQNLGSRLKGAGWKRIMLLEEKKSSCFPPRLTKDTAVQSAKPTLPNNNPIPLLSCDYIFCVSMHGNRNYYICAAA